MNVKIIVNMKQSDISSNNRRKFLAIPFVLFSIVIWRNSRLLPANCSNVNSGYEKYSIWRMYLWKETINNAKIILSSLMKSHVGLNSRLQRVWQLSSWRRKKSFIYCLHYRQQTCQRIFLKYNVVWNFEFHISSEVKVRCVRLIWYFDEKLIPNYENIKNKIWNNIF